MTWERVDAEDGDLRACPSVDRRVTPRLLDTTASQGRARDDERDRSGRKASRAAREANDRAEPKPADGTDREKGG